MAIMIPEVPRAYTKSSLEDEMFNTLKELSDDYYVFHSFKIARNVNGTFYESETDFLIFNRRKGLLCIEAKAGRVSYSKGEWRYSNGRQMKKGGPFAQASGNKWKLKSHIEKSEYQNLLGKCKLLHAVWFPSISKIDLQNISLPADAEKCLIMTKESLSNVQEKIDQIFQLRLPSGIETNLSENEEKGLLESVLCPAFDIFPTISFENDIKKKIFHRLLKEQVGILKYLGDQTSAVINGAAGTGKTMIAVEKAKMHAFDNQQVLFLCYNKFLKDFLIENYKHKNIHYYTIDGLACKLCNSSKPDYTKLKANLEDMYLLNRFPYDHIIIDEGQDFGQDKIEEIALIELLKDIIVDKKSNNSFYIFYDRLQLVQGQIIPKYISEADCKLTLYRNCRNTENIAKTSMATFNEKPKLFDAAVKGKASMIYFTDDEIGAVNERIEEYHKKGINDIVILTCTTEKESLLACEGSRGFYHDVQFTTCRKFKGLEADAIILVDVDPLLFKHNRQMIFYVGASRARIELSIITSMTNSDCKEILKETFSIEGNIKSPKKELSRQLKTLCKLNNV
ncbi:NERD domain-containing protein [uncultured Vagococcus sp.]|uniref:nuclease-related domain-containing DEAD/DEAH box helicase n=1 Tax=uncultured Vagococcus sp. TaxID=189676 RepID=UPI0028D794D8|nr:NERD domain-containing protein [uncultured Vagococcus sp.]